MKTSASLCAMMILCVMAASPQTPEKHDGVFVDGDGVLRWKGSNSEVAFFGVNYTAPFAYAYRAHTRLGLSVKEAIDLDVAQMVRLGFDAFRVHVWDREISDEQGNILTNAHLDLFDYLLYRLSEAGISTVVTPIAWWGNGWPEPDESLKGFSQRYSKPELMTNREARDAQKRYLRQFIEHRNLYRKLSYRQDPAIIALEIINEPRHPESGEATTGYIDEMTEVIRSNGWSKPVFFNISENWSDVQANAVTKAQIDGISFQWYPTDLGHNAMLKGNYLINVNRYAIPSDAVAGYGTKAKMVYEFDAADVGGSYMYPAIARSFREAGMQFATMFAYDPVQIAWSNTEYRTHYVNLLYAPSKALSLMIAGKAFHQLPRMKSFGKYPANNSFGDFRVSYDEDLSEMNTAGEFIYSNTTASTPTDPASLRLVAGCGNSPVVRYDGTGAYFLDRLSVGIWRMEVYPDVLWLRDPFGPTSMSRQTARLFWSERGITVTLPDLGDEYLLRRQNGKTIPPAGPGAYRHRITPGVYLLTSKSVNGKAAAKFTSTGSTFLKGLSTPAAPSPGTYVVNSTSECVVESSRVDFRFQIAGERKVINPTLHVRRLGWRGFEKHLLKHIGGFTYVMTDTLRGSRAGPLEYCVSVDDGTATLSFPGGVPQTPGAWDYSPENLWTIAVIRPEEPFVLLNPYRDRKDFVFPHFKKGMRYAVDYINGSTGDNVALSVKVSYSDEDSPPFGLQLSTTKWANSLGEGMHAYRHLLIKARAPVDSLILLGITLIMSDGAAYGVTAGFRNSWQEKELSLSSFKSVNGLILPDSYPLFLPHVWQPDHAVAADQPDLRQLQAIQITAGRAKGTGAKEIGFELESVTLSR